MNSKLLGAHFLQMRQKITVLKGLHIYVFVSLTSIADSLDFISFLSDNFLNEANDDYQII